MLARSCCHVDQVRDVECEKGIEEKAHRMDDCKDMVIAMGGDMAMLPGYIPLSTSSSQAPPTASHIATIQME